MIPPDALAEFRRRFGRDPEIAVRAPGRVNLIGEHTDYNGGFVFPCAIDREVVVLAASSDSGSTFVSRELGRSEFRITEADVNRPAGWARYGAGMAVMLEDRGIPRRDIVACVQSDIPMGSGVSSSAALEMAFGLVYKGLAGVEIPAAEMARIAQRAENRFVGVNCGIMDQMASACGREGQAMFLDTRDLSIVYAPIPAHVEIVLLDTKKPRALTDSAYNERRSQCETACAVLGVRELRDSDLPTLVANQTEMDPTVFRRARHVVSENERARDFYRSLQLGDLDRAGKLMRASHASLRDDYEVSCHELDAMAEAAQNAGAIGARMTGAGFGGCCVALVDREHVAIFEREVLLGYRRKTDRQGEAIRLKAVNGASIFGLE